MTALREAAQQALAFTMRDFATMRDFEAARAVLHDNLRAALKQEEEASAWLAERKEYWRKEKEKMQVTKDQDPELSAALGWPGGTSDPALDRTRLLQMVAALRLASQQALEALGLAKLNGKAGLYPAETEEIADAITALRAALAQQAEPVAVAERERIAAQWDGCITHQLDTFGPVDIGASIRAGELVEPAQQAEPVATLTAQRDALLEALKLARSIIGHPDDAHSRLIDAAIKAVEEGE